MISTVLMVILAVGSGEAEGDKVTQAKTYFEAGKQAYEASRYAIAISAFDEAYRLSPRSQILFSLAQALRQAQLRTLFHLCPNGREGDQQRRLSTPCCVVAKHTFDSTQ